MIGVFFLSPFHIKALQLLEVQSKFGHLKREFLFSTAHQCFVKMGLARFC